MPAKTKPAEATKGKTPKAKPAPSLAQTERKVAILERRELLARRKKVITDFGVETRRCEKEIRRLRRIIESNRKRQPRELEKLNRALAIVQARLAK